MKPDKQQLPPPPHENHLLYVLLWAIIALPAVYFSPEEYQSTVSTICIAIFIIAVIIRNRRHQNKGDS